MPEITTEHHAKLMALIRNRALRHGDVTLASGEQSDFYIDGRMIAVCPEGAYRIGEVLFEETKDIEFDAMGGLAVGAVPMITSFVTSCFHRERDVEGFFVRAEAKSHGTKKLVEGRLKQGDRVIIVDDVVTSGGSVMKAIRAAEDVGARVVLVLSIVDRDRGAAEMFASHGYAYRSVFTKQDVLDAGPG